MYKLTNTVTKILTESYLSEEEIEEIKNDIKEEEMEVSEYIWAVDEGDLEEYFPDVYSHYFGDPTTYADVVYHQTTPENWEIIKTEGIKVKNDTRGLTNRWTPPAVFTSIEIDEMGSYGSITLEIDLSKVFESDPEIHANLEEPVLESERRKMLAIELGEDPDQYELPSSDGIQPTTLVVYGDIPPEAITLIDN